MRKTTYICDHCGKEIDTMNDYTDMKIDNFIDLVEVDLCLSCFEELNEEVLKYVGKKIER